MFSHFCFNFPIYYTKLHYMCFTSNIVHQRSKLENELLLVDRKIYTGILGKTIQAIDRSKHLKEVILKIKFLYKSLLCIFNFVGPGYFNPLGIRNDLFYILIVSDIRYLGPTTLNQDEGGKGACPLPYPLLLQRMFLLLQSFLNRIYSIPPRHK